ncbi:MAG: hypothetical protein EBT79_08600 [Actinobacteria bacterium]|nr:hypothetical protein [Actinomycetota bacterium]NBR67313.1 hypothetical protein [Actinomycetota bacterium]
MTELEAVNAGFDALYEAARAADDNCWWCCGGGDQWCDELLERRAAVFAAYPDLDPAPVTTEVA